MARTVRALAPQRQTPPAVRQRADKYFSKVIGKALDIATVESPHLIRMGNTVGRIVPPHASSLGKAIAAFQRDVRDRLIRSYGIHRFTDHTITDEVELRREFERVRARGFSTDAEESVLEGCCFGAPILDADGHSIAAISVSSPKMRMQDDELRKRLIEATRHAAHSVSSALAERKLS